MYMKKSIMWNFQPKISKRQRTFLLPPWDGPLRILVPTIQHFQFYKSDLSAIIENGSALIVFYSQELENTQAKIEQAGGVIKKEIFSFPGGRRFHFTDPSGNEYAVWSDVGTD
jgi:hypothetical protein